MNARELYAETRHQGRAEIGRFPEVSTAEIEFVACGLYQPIEGGQHAIIARVMEYSTLVDLVAWRPGKPRQWALRTGTAWCLGLADIERAASFDEVLSMHETPADWLAADAAGAVILDPTSLWARWFPLKVVISSPEHGAQLARWLTPPTPPLPEMFVTERAA